MVIVFVIQKRYRYLLGRHFTARTDQHSLQYFLGKRVIYFEYLRWLSKLLGMTLRFSTSPGWKTREPIHFLDNNPQPKWPTWLFQWYWMSRGCVNKWLPMGTYQKLKEDWKRTHTLITIILYLIASCWTRDGWQYQKGLIWFIWSCRITTGAHWEVILVFCGLKKE